MKQQFEQAKKAYQQMIIQDAPVGPALDDFRKQAEAAL